MIYIYIAPFIPKDLRVPHRLKYPRFHRSNASRLWCQPARQEKRTWTLPRCLEQEAFLGSWSNISSSADLAGPRNQTCGELSGLYLLLRQKGLRWSHGGFQLSHRRSGDQGRSFLTSEVHQLPRTKVFVNDPQHTGAAQYISRPLAEEGKHYPQGRDEDGTCPLGQHHAWGELRSVEFVPHELPHSEHLFRAPCSPPHTASCCAERHCEHSLPPPGCFQKRFLNINLLIFKCVF